MEKDFRCECGARLVSYGHDVDCGRCGRSYNAVGQALAAHAVCCSLYAQGVDCGCGEGN